MGTSSVKTVRLQCHVTVVLAIVQNTVVSFQSLHVLCFSYINFNVKAVRLHVNHCKHVCFSVQILSTLHVLTIIVNTVSLHVLY